MNKEEFIAFTKGVIESYKESIPQYMNGNRVEVKLTGPLKVIEDALIELEKNNKKEYPWYIQKITYTKS